MGPPVDLPAIVAVPRWTLRLRELWFGPRLVKRFSNRAGAQELILSAFQEEGWPTAIDDPLPPTAETDPKRRLHYTVRNLNRCQSPPYIQFSIGGLGQLVRWRIGRAKRRKARNSLPARGAAR